MSNINLYNSLKYHLEQAIISIDYENYQKLYIHMWNLNYMWKLIKIKEEREFVSEQEISNPDFGI